MRRPRSGLSNLIHALIKIAAFDKIIPQLTGVSMEKVFKIVLRRERSSLSSADSDERAVYVAGDAAHEEGCRLVVWKAEGASQVKVAVFDEYQWSYFVECSALMEQEECDE